MIAAKQVQQAREELMSAKLDTRYLLAGIGEPLRALCSAAEALADAVEQVDRLVCEVRDGKQDAPLEFGRDA